ncbi:hypothetical protein [Candidatus Nitrosocosmicus sp. FF01]
MGHGIWKKDIHYRVFPTPFSFRYSVGAITIERQMRMLVYPQEQVTSF